jgi:xylose isomerase
MPSYFSEIKPIAFQGPQSKEPLAYRYYDKDRLVLGKRMEDQLRFCVAWWHSFCNVGKDIFGDGTFDRSWNHPSDPLEVAKLRAESAFDFFTKLGVKYYAFHDRDIAPEGETPKASLENLRVIVDVLAKHQASTGVKLLWGTANLFGNKRYMAGGGSNPDPEVFAFGAAQIKAAMDATKALGGENYVLWGGREGYETLLNTNLKQEVEQLGRLLTMVVEYKHKIGFKGAILVEPKPCEPSKHQYDFDVATLYGFLRRFGLEKEVKANIESNHATLAGHTFEHEIATAFAYDIFGSIDMNRGDPLLGWDTDQFPNSLLDTTLAMYTIMKGGGFTSGGLNFDAKVRRQSTDPVDLFHAHVGAIDLTAHALLIAEKMIKDGALEKIVKDRYQGWSGPLGQDILGGKANLETLSKHVLDKNQDIRPVSGRQEYIENLLNRFLVD